MKSQLLIPEPPLQVLPSLAKAIGLNEAIFLQQLHYWLIRSKHHHEGRIWVYNTYEEWAEQFPFWSPRTIKRIVSTLRDNGYIETSSNFNKLPIDNTLWYTLIYENLPGEPSKDAESANLARPECQPGTAESANLARPLPLDYTENTTENTTTYGTDKNKSSPQGVAHEVSPEDSLPVRLMNYAHRYNPNMLMIGNSEKIAEEFGLSMSQAERRKGVYAKLEEYADLIGEDSMKQIIDKTCVEKRNNRERPVTHFEYFLYIFREASEEAQAEVDALKEYQERRESILEEMRQRAERAKKWSFQ